MGSAEDCFRTCIRVLAIRLMSKVSVACDVPAESSTRRRIVKLLCRRPHILLHLASLLCRCASLGGACSDARCCFFQSLADQRALQAELAGTLHTWLRTAGGAAAAGSGRSAAALAERQAAAQQD